MQHDSQEAFSSHKLTGPAVAAADLGPIDVVLLSHDHHGDNLDTTGRALLPTAAATEDHPRRRRSVCTPTSKWRPLPQGRPGPLGGQVVQVGDADAAVALQIRVGIPGSQSLSSGLDVAALQPLVVAGLGVLEPQRREVAAVLNLAAVHLQHPCRTLRP